MAGTRLHGSPMSFSRDMKTGLAAPGDKKPASRQAVE